MNDNLNDIGFDNDNNLDNYNLRFTMGDEEFTAQVLKENAKIAERHGGYSKVFVGEIMGRREDFNNLCFYATISYPVRNAEFKGTQRVEGHIKCSSLVEFAALSNIMHLGKILVLDKETKKIIESCTW